MSGHILSFVLNILQQAAEEADTTGKALHIRKCVKKFSKYLDLTENKVDGHLESCTQYCESGDVVDTCSCHFYIHVYPIELVKEIIQVFYLKF